MTAPALHICLVSDQLIANYLPARMLGAGRALLVCTAEMAQSLRPAWLSQALAAVGTAAEIWSEPCPTGPLPEIEAFARHLAECAGRRWPGHRLVLNLTGGTKLMAIGFDRGLPGAPRESIYLDTQHGHLACMQDDFCREIPLPLPDDPAAPAA